MHSEFSLGENISLGYKENTIYLIMSWILGKNNLWILMIK